MHVYKLPDESDKLSIQVRILSHELGINALDAFYFIK